MRRRKKKKKNTKKKRKKRKKREEMRMKRKFVVPGWLPRKRSKQSGKIEHGGRRLGGKGLMTEVICTRVRR